MLLSASDFCQQIQGQSYCLFGLVLEVKGVPLAMKAVASFADAPETEILPDCLMDVMKEWGCCWMWKTLRLTGDKDWIKGAIERGTLTAVTDGSYIKEICPGLCSAAFILECNEKSGRIIESFSEASPAANAYLQRGTDGFGGRAGNKIPQNNARPVAIQERCCTRYCGRS